ncbi:MAG: Ig-like domain-containing protein, partial [Halanaerobiales bacterium]
MKPNIFKKKLLIIALAFILIFALAACSSNNDNDKLVISSIEDVANIEVAYGTSSDEAISNLDPTVTIELSNGDKETPDISWSAPEDYQATTPGTYMFSGVFTTVDELNGTVEAEVTVLTDKTGITIQEVENAIAALPADITLEDEADVISARDAYNSLSPEQQAMVENAAILESAVTKITELNIELSEIAITELGNPADITLEDEADVIAARDLVEKTFDLGAAEADITNLEQLIAAEKKITELRDGLGELETAVQDAETAIRALPLAENITLADREEVASARILVQTAYDSGAVETDISNLWKLEDAELKIEEIENQTAAAEIDNKITLLPTPAELTMSDKVDIETIRNSYESLTDTQKGLVTNLSVLESAEAVYAVASTAAEVETNADKADVRFITISTTITQDVNISTNKDGDLTLNGDYLIDANLVVDAANLTFTNKL